MLTSKDVRDPRIFSGIICHEAAAAIHGLTDDMVWPLQIFSTENVSLKNSSLLYVHVPRIDYEDTEHIGGLLYITNPERTICDLINKGIRKSAIYNAITVYSNICDLDILRGYATKYSCYDQLEIFVATLDDYWETFQG